MRVHDTHEVLPDDLSSHDVHNQKRSCVLSSFAFSVTW
jgi:hypothetical protein